MLQKLASCPDVLSPMALLVKQDLIPVPNLLNSSSLFPPFSPKPPISLQILEPLRHPSRLPAVFQQRLLSTSLQFSPPLLTLLSVLHSKTTEQICFSCANLRISFHAVSASLTLNLQTQQGLHDSLQLAAALLQPSKQKPSLLPSPCQGRLGSLTSRAAVTCHSPPPSPSPLSSQASCPREPSGRAAS